MFLHVTRKDKGELYGISISCLLRKLHTDVLNGSSSLPALNDSFSFPTFSLHLLSLVFMMIIILTWVRWTLSIVLNYISLMAKDAEQFFKCVLVLAICLLRSSNLVHFLIYRLEDFFLTFSFCLFLEVLQILYIYIKSPVQSIVGKFCFFSLDTIAARHKLTMILTACTRPVENQSRVNPEWRIVLGMKSHHQLSDWQLLSTWEGKVTLP